MEYIKTSIYSRPEIRRVVLPLWSAWALTAVGAVCGVLYFTLQGLTTGGSSALLGGMAVGGFSLAVVVCYYLFGDSRRPYSKELHAVMEPTIVYYASQYENLLIEVLQSGDEQALEGIKRSATPELALVRYSDKRERVFYSQLTRVAGERFIPITEIIVNDLRKK
jgi:hypothetical protein